MTEEEERIELERLRLAGDPAGASNGGVRGVKKRYVKVPPEASDGDHWTIAPLGVGCQLSDILTEWAEHSDEGDTVTLTVVEMTDEEVDALPEI